MDQCVCKENCYAIEDIFGYTWQEEIQENEEIQEEIPQPPPLVRQPEPKKRGRPKAAPKPKPEPKKRISRENDPNFIAICT